MTTRQLKRRVPSGAQLPQRWRWSRIRTSGDSVQPYSFPPNLHCLGQALRGSLAIPLYECLSDLVVTIGFVQHDRHGDAKAPVVESDL